MMPGPDLVPPLEAEKPHTLRLRRLGIDTYQEPVVYIRHDCPVCRSEGFEAQARIRVDLSGRSIVATLNVVAGELLESDEAGLSEAAWKLLGAEDGREATFTYSEPLDSFGLVRAKIFGRRLDQQAMNAIVRDVAAGRYADIHLAAFVTACAGAAMDRDEMLALTRAMIDAGERMDWGTTPVVDKHCIGGLPGNRTTLIVVPIVAECGLLMPKTSSRAITSPAGTADVMETLAPVELDVADIRRVVEKVGACIVWGGAVRLSPADDVLIRVERPLDIDSEGQVVASILSKKVAAGATHVVIDIPVGATAKVRSAEAAAVMGENLTEVGRAVGLQVLAVPSNGSQPVGRGVGPALEARDVLAVLRGQPAAPADLRERALVLAGRLLEFGGSAAPGEGLARATKVLDDGGAWRRFQEICDAQGGMREPPSSAYKAEMTAPSRGVVTGIDNRILARVAKLAGAPRDPAAGLEMLCRLGDTIEVGQPLFVIHAQSPGELAYAQGYARAHAAVVRVE